MDEEMIKIHGDPPGTKAEGVCRVLYENINGLNNRMGGNKKLDKARQLIHELEADIVAYNEHRLNLTHSKNRNGLRKMFQGDETEVRAMAAHNKHEASVAGRFQEGGTCLLAYGTVLDYYDKEASGVDESGLGRWSHMVFRGDDGFLTRVVCGYSPCYNRNLASGTSYAQQKRYWLASKGNDCCPRAKLKEELIAKLKEWRKSGDRLIVCMDANEHVYNKSLGRDITDPNGLDMLEVVGQFTGTELGATYFRGSTPIDAVWATTDVQVVNACAMPCGYGAGDHRLFVIDFLISSMVGQSPIKVIRPAARRLNTRIPEVATKYITALEKLISRHRLIERLGHAHESGRSNKWIARQINRIDQEGAELMRAAERKCRKIRAGCIPFSPTAMKWLRRLQIYRALRQQKAGKKKNYGNLARAAIRAGIGTPLQLGETELQARIEVCLQKTEALKKTGWAVRRRYLKDKSSDAQERGDEVKVTQILALIRRERERAFWGRLRFALGKKRGRSVASVQVEDTRGAIMEYSGQQPVQDAIFSEVHRKRFFLAEQAPICNGWMRGAFGYLARSPTAKAILDGSYIYPTDFDEATKELCMECARIRQTIPTSSVSSIIRRHEWCKRWSKAREDTSSSVSGLHFGHHKAAASSPVISHFHALKASLVMKRGIVLERWGKGLSVMIEKMYGCTMVSKLRSILLMEADFNFANKTIFGTRMLGNARKYNLIPEEIFSERNKTADDGTLTKTLFFDLSRQSRRPAGVASVDADNCYDRVAHAMASLCFQAFGIEELAVQTMLGTIQEMKFFLRTAYGDSTTFAGSSIEMKTQGLCQGNGAAPAGWAIVSVVILNAHKQRRHGATFRCPITNGDGKLAAVLFVDDTDLLHMDMTRTEMLEETHEALQSSVTSWGTKLLATGGALKPPKCFYYLIDYDWLEDGTWKYRQLEDDDLIAFQIKVPLASGRMHPIDYVPPGEARKTLGAMTCPTGDCTLALEKMRTQAQEWVDTAKNGKLHRRHIWFMLQKQFWARIGYALCVNTAPLAVLEEVCRRPFYALLPLLGVRRSVHVSLRSLDSGFGGIGLPHTGIECCIAQLNKLVMHYGCKSALGTMLQSSMEFFVLEMGLSAKHPFAPSYKKFNSLVTDSWLKSLWEKISTFGISVSIGNIDLTPPRVNDKWLMQAFIEEGIDIHELAILNRVRLHQEVLFVSDVLNARGSSVDQQYTVERPGGEKWSRFTFPREQPTETDMALWRNALYRISPMGRAVLRLREFTSAGHRRWDWRYDEGNNRLLHRAASNDVLTVYEQTGPEGAPSRVNRWIRNDEVHVAELQGQLCSVKRLSDTAVSLQGTTAPPGAPPPAQTLLDVLAQAQERWLWEDIEITGDEEWIIHSIRDKSCVAVTDGSYMPTAVPGACSAAFILECSRGRGTITGSFVERSPTACAYRGELMGLMAIHLILEGVNRISPGLPGEVHLFSDCLGAIGMVEHIPAPRIPTRCKHSDVLKNIMVNCGGLPFTVAFSHVAAHQDDTTSFHLLDRPAQLNCLMDTKAKEALLRWSRKDVPPQKPFPLEPIAVFAGQDKITGDSGEIVRFWAHRQLARQILPSRKILDTGAFDRVDWANYWTAIRATPRLFQLWASKQMMNLAHTNKFKARLTPRASPLCPSCQVHVETCSHITLCPEKGRVQALTRALQEVDTWLESVFTDPCLRHCIVKYAQSRGRYTMSEICSAFGLEYRAFSSGQDLIGWRRFMEGLVDKEVSLIQHRYMKRYHIQGDAKKWTQRLIVKLLECTHGQWLYRNIMVHDSLAGEIANDRKETIRRQIEEQFESEEELLEEHQYLLDLNVGDMTIGTGDKQEYWLLAVQAARRAKQLAQGGVTKGIG